MTFPEKPGALLFLSLARKFHWEFQEFVSFRRIEPTDRPTNYHLAPPNSNRTVNKVETETSERTATWFMRARYRSPWTQFVRGMLFPLFLHPPVWAYHHLCLSVHTVMVKEGKVEEGSLSRLFQVINHHEHDI